METLQLKLSHTPLWALLFLASSSSVAEPILGFELGSSFWYAETEGTMQSISDTSGSEDTGDSEDTGNAEDTESPDDTSSVADTVIALNSLGLSEKLATELFFAYHHNFPLIPQFKARYTTLSHEEQSTPETDIIFAGETFAAGTELTTAIDMTWQDLEMYYRLIDSWITFNLGVNVNNFSSSADLYSTTKATEPGDETDVVTDSDIRATLEVNELTTMLLAHYGLKLPEVPISFAGKVNYYKSGDTSISDMENFIAINLETQSGAIEGQLGYRTRKYIHPFEELDIDFKSSGYFLSLSYSF